MCASTREWIYCILDVVHILGVDSTVVQNLLNRNRISKGSQDKNILCYWTLNISQDTDIYVLVDTTWITGQITGQIDGYSGQT